MPSAARDEALDAGGVSGVERVDDVNGEGQQDFSFQRAAGGAVPEGQPIQKLHGDERLAMLVVDFVDSSDVRMIQGRSGLGFPLKAG